MSELTIVKEDGERRGRYVARLVGIDAEAELTFRCHDPGVISADHTGVPDAMGGHGVAKALLAVMLDDARSADFRIIPLCPFVRGQYAEHPEWAELFTTKPGDKDRLPSGAGLQAGGKPPDVVTKQLARPVVGQVARAII